MTLRTRFAPSPTGFLHVGGARTALFCYLQARRHGGTFILRIEDTDRERSTEESVQAILDGLAWLGLDYDEGPIFQSQRFERYAEVITSMLAEGKAYHCYCSRERIERLREEQMAKGLKPRYDGHCRERKDRAEGIQPVVRFRNPDHGVVRFDDRVRGPISISNAELDDLVVARPDGAPTYNFTVVVDDMDMGITDVIRGDDHINNTPRQINIYHALGVEPPAFAHVPMILGDDGARLSKRHGAVSVLQYREDGYLPEALLNYLVRLGWSHGDQEIFSLDEMVALFDINEVNRKAAAFNTSKLDWLNQHYMKTLDPGHVARELAWHFEVLGVNPSQGPALDALVQVQAERVTNLRQMAEQSRCFYQPLDRFDEGAAHKHLRPVAQVALQAIATRLSELSSWEPEALDEAVRLTAAELEIGMGKIAQPLRVALTGTAVSPSIDKTLWLTGRERSIQRIDRALGYVAARAAEAGSG